MAYRAPGVTTDARQLREHVRQLYDGKSNNTGSVTLRASQTTTTITDARIGPGSTLPLVPRSANAAGALATTYVSAKGQGTATLTHASTAAVDKTFDYAVIG